MLEWIVPDHTQGVTTTDEADQLRTLNAGSILARGFVRGSTSRAWFVAHQPFLRDVLFDITLAGIHHWLVRIGQIDTREVFARYRGQRVWWESTRVTERCDPEHT